MPSFIVCSLVRSFVHETIFVYSLTYTHIYKIIYLLIIFFFYNIYIYINVIYIYVIYIYVIYIYVIYIYVIYIYVYSLFFNASPLHAWHLQNPHLYIMFVAGRNARCQALAGHTKLQTLRLCENPLGEAGHAPLLWEWQHLWVENDHRKSLILNTV